MLRCRAEGCTQLERGAVLPGAGRGQGLKAEVAAGSQQCVCVCVHVVGAAPRVHGDVWLSLRCVSCCAGRACAAPLGWMGGGGGGGSCGSFRISSLTVDFLPAEGVCKL